MDSGLRVEIRLGLLFTWQVHCILQCTLTKFESKPSPQTNALWRTVWQVEQTGAKKQQRKQKTIESDGQWKNASNLSISKWWPDRAGRSGVWWCLNKKKIVVYCLPGEDWSTNFSLGHANARRQINSLNKSQIARPNMNSVRRKWAFSDEWIGFCWSISMGFRPFLAKKHFFPLLSLTFSTILVHCRCFFIPIRFLPLFLCSFGWISCDFLCSFLVFRVFRPKIISHSSFVSFFSHSNSISIAFHHCDSIAPLILWRPASRRLLECRCLCDSIVYHLVKMSHSVLQIVWKNVFMTFDGIGGHPTLSFVGQQRWEKETERERGSGGGRKIYFSKCIPSQVTRRHFKVKCRPEML